MTPRKPKARKVEAYAVVLNGVGDLRLEQHRAALDFFAESGVRVVHLIEAPDPKLARLDAAVLKAAEKWLERGANLHPDFRPPRVAVALARAIERRKKAGKVAG